jgi:hypothetical protein
MSRYPSAVLTGTAPEAISVSPMVWRRLMPILLVAAVALAGAMLTLAGWRSRIPNFDILTTIDVAQQLLSSGRVPDRGVLTSFGSFTPPGAAWLMAPGMIAFQEPRLFEFVASIGLYFGTIAGIFLLSRRLLGWRSAVLAATLYACSQLGLTAASSVWQRYPIHAFSVWVVYWAVRWAEERKSKFLAGSLLTWAVGMYVFMEMAPSILVIPAFWLARRPPIRVAPVAIALALAALVWLPYLRFEQSRGFIDLRSQLQQIDIQPALTSLSWCDASVVPAQWAVTAATPPPEQRSTPRPALVTRLKQRAADRAATIVRQFLLAGFSNISLVPGAGVLLCLLAVGGAGFLLFPIVAFRRVQHEAACSTQLIRVGVVLALAGLVCNEVVLGSLLRADGALSHSTVLLIRWLQAVTLMAAFALTLGNRVLVRTMQSAVARWTATADPRLGDPMLLGLAILTPWLALLLVADFDRRFWWLWPMQVISLAAAVTYLPMRLRAPRWIHWVGALAVVAVVGSNTVLASRVQEWKRDGWSGHDAIEIEVTDRIAEHLQSVPGTPAAIGYEVNFWKFMAVYHGLDSRYKVGADLDLLLKYRHGITNVDQCAEGLSSDDVFRALQLNDAGADPLNGLNRMVVPLDHAYRPLETVNGYEILERRAPDFEN